ncbi:MAG: hypothetical protein HY581_05110 [Nitrospirae bacterium]|nr:hypothetical protein [Nitrospirota bacterium]
MRFWLNRVRSVIVLVAGFCWVMPSTLAAQEISWDRLAEGLAVTVWDPTSHCGDEVPRLFLVKVDPERYRFSTYHYRDEGLPAPLTIQEWQQRTRASVLFNAGLFREDFSYLGLLFKEGRSLGTKRHGVWQGLFVAEPVEPGLRKAGVLDLAFEPFDEEKPAYREAAQSLMLLDRTGKPRVRQTGKRAHQTIVAEDGAGNIVVMKTADVVGLRALADCLHKRFPTIHHAMAMDGGASSDLLIDADLMPEHHGGENPRPWHPLVDSSGMPHIPLPSIIGALPRVEATPPHGGGEARPRAGRP